jgi:ribosomal subunit interface protein
MPKTIIQSKNYQVPQAIKDYLEEKLASLDKIWPAILDARVELFFDQTVKEGKPFRAEINLRMSGKRLLRAESAGVSIFEAIDIMERLIKRELIKFKEKIER